MATSLYFPEGVPQEVQRLLNPDAIHQVTREGLGALEREWSILARSADKITKGDLGFWKGLFKHLSYDPSPNWIQHFLYQKPSDWPSGLSEKEKDALKILRELRKLSSTSSHLLTAEDYQNPPPSEQAMAKALSRIAKSGYKLLARMERGYGGMLDVGGRKIAPLCDQVYGEPCTEQEGAEIMNGDIEDLWKMDQWPTSQAMGDVLNAYLEVMYQ